MTDKSVDQRELDTLLGADYLSEVKRDALPGALWTAFGTLLNMPLALVVSVITARALHPSGLGQFALYFTVFSVGTIVANFGWTEAAIQWAAAAFATHKPEDALRITRLASTFHLLIAGPLLAVATGFMLAPRGPVIAALGATVGLLLPWLYTTYVLLTAGARNRRSAQAALIGTSISQVGLGLAALATHDAAIAWTTQTGLLAVAPLIALFFLSPVERQAVLVPDVSLRPPPGFAMYGLAACAAAVVATLVYGRSEVFVLRAHDLLRDIGIFSVVTGLASRITSPLDSLLAPLAPIAAGMVASDFEAAQRTFLRSLKLTAVIGGLCAGALIPLGATVIPAVYGHAFSSAAGPFLVLGVVSCVATASVPCLNFASALRAVRPLLFINVVALVADAALAIALVPFLGLWGAVTANAFAQGIALVLTALLTTRRLAVNTGDIMRALRPMVAGAVVGTACGATALLASDALAVRLGIDIAGAAGLLMGVRLFRGLQLTTADLSWLSNRESRVSRYLIAVLRVTGVLQAGS